jgi:tetratricopeptide (TPR) repeat protein
MHSAWRPWSDSSSMETVGVKSDAAPASRPNGPPVVITMSNITAASERPPTLAVAPAVAVHGRRKGPWALKLVGTCAIVILSSFSAWWYWRDHRALPDLKTVSEWVRRNQYARAEPVLREYLRRSSRDGEARMMLARALAGRGDFLGCARQLHEVPFGWPRKAEALLREGQAYLQIDRAKDAEDAWLNALRDDPVHPISPDLFHDVVQDLLKIYAIEDRWEDAYPVIWTAYDHASPAEHPDLLVMRMRPELERVAPKDSIEILRRYVAAAADDWEALRALARAEQALNNSAEAARLFQIGMKGNPDNVRAWHDYLAMLLEQGDPDAFITLLRQAPPGSADSEPKTWMFRAVASENAQDLPAAAQFFRKAIELDPTVPKYYYRLAMVEQRLGLHKEARAHLGRSKEMNEARAQLPAAYSDYFAARDRMDGSKELAAVCKHLASICETLGWSRAALGWRRLAIAP